MKRILMLILPLILVFTSVVCYAEEQSNPPFDIDGELGKLGSEQLLDEIPEEAKETLDKMNFSGMSISEIIAMSPNEFFNVIKNIVVTQVRRPIQIFATLIGIILLSAFLTGMKQSFLDNSLNGVFSVVSALCVISFISEPIVKCISSTARGLQQCALFILSFIPVFTGVVAAGGHPLTATTYNIFLFTACQIVSQVAASVLIPLMSIYFAMCLVSSAAPEMNLDGITSFIKTSVCWVLGLMTTIFVGLFSIQTLVGTGSDALATKAGRFIIGSFIPVVGGALSDAFSAAQGCLLLMKSTLGAFAVVIALLT
ncbi:MAG: hypothetical protein RR205_05695, partial [Oscillospiraceae bacterium]